MKTTLFVLIVSALTLAACGTLATPAATEQTTLVPPTETPVPPTQTPTLTPKATRTPAPTATPTISLAIQAFGPLMFVASDNVVCRSGPNRIYPQVSRVPEGQRVPILGTESVMPYELAWWYVSVDNINCWVSSYFGWTYGSKINIPIIETPLPPTPKP